MNSAMMDMSVNITEATKLELEKVLQGIDYIPTVKKQIEEELKMKLGQEKVEKVFEVKTFDDMELDKEEAINLFKVMYAFTKDDKFNPVRILSDKKVRKGEKDGDKSLYYNYDFKIKFVEKSYKETTQRVVKALFRRTAKLEKVYEKDLYDFSQAELEEVLRSMKSTTVRSLQNIISTIEQYIDYALRKKVTNNKFNYATVFDSKEKVEPLLDAEAVENMIFDKEEIMDIAMNTDNPQDGVILGLLFDGVSHKNEFEELVNLTEDNIDYDNQEIQLDDRRVPMSTETMILVKEALKQDQVYVSISGDKVRNYKVADGKHVLRGLRGKNKVKGQLISQRILRIAELYEYEQLKATTISYSGQLHMAKELLSKKFSLEDTINKVLKRFGIENNTYSQFYLKGRIEKFLKL